MRQKDVNYRMVDLVSTNDQQLANHQKFKQLIGYKERMAVRASVNHLKHIKDAANSDLFD